jgi:ABC-type transport system involved in cytochrome bd biosynthesis fused ATPase/permease subunit
MAIMRASGAGKSTSLDILARKRKRGVTLVNGREVKYEEFQEDDEVCGSGGYADGDVDGV